MLSRLPLIACAALIVLGLGANRINHRIASGVGLQTPPIGCATPPCQAVILDFPAKETDLDAMRASADPTAMRDHAWKLLLHLTKDAEADTWQRPSWETDLVNWKTKCELNLNPLCTGGAPGPPVTDPRQPVPVNSPQVDPTTRSAISTVFYSLDTANWIKTNHLDQSSTLKQILATSTKPFPSLEDSPSTVVPDLGRTGIVIKEIWQGFRLTGGKVIAYGPLVDHQQFPDGALYPVSRWPLQAHLSLLQTGGHLDVNTKCQPVDYDGATKPVPIRCFPYQISKGNCQNLVKLDPSGASQILDTGGYSPVEACAVVLVGIQIATKELKNWTWSTFWWVNQPSLSNFMKGQPSNLPSGYQHFAMNTMLSPDVVPPDAAPVTPVYNPYLEGPGAKGTLSNCLQCHAHARFQACIPGSATPNCGVRRGGVMVDAAFFGQPQPPCNATGADRIAQGCSVLTGFLWSLDDNQDAVLNHPFLRFVHRFIPDKAEKNR